MPEEKITQSERHLLQLIKNGKEADGWTNVSDTLWPLIEKLPVQLVERNYSGHRVRLTMEGNVVVDWL